MEPVLDEMALVPCQALNPGRRISGLAEVLRSLDELGAARVLRATRNAADLDLLRGRGLRSWCFDAGTDRDAGRLVASRLGRQPFIDGPGGLFSIAEGRRAVEPSARGQVALGLGLAALNGSVALAIRGEANGRGGPIPVELLYLDEDGETSENVVVLCLVVADDVSRHREEVLGLIDLSVRRGADVLERAPELFPSLRFGTDAQSQISGLNGSEPVFKQLLRHLRALDLGARRWQERRPYEPAGALPWSVESRATLEDGRLGPQRDFPVPEGFPQERWSYHTKLTGGAGARLYFKPVRTGTQALVLVGYFGSHLATVRNRN